MPAPLRPMLAVAGELPPDGDAAWAYELKWDGVRTVVEVEAGGVRAWSRAGNDVTRSYPELAALAPALGARDAVLDGEVIAMDPSGRPSFGLLQRRMHVTRAADVERLRHEVPVRLLAFDVLALDGTSLLAEPWHRRREALEGLGLDASPCCTVSPAFPPPGSDVRAAAAAQGLEGVVAKRRDAPYRPGVRSEAWRKVKQVRSREVVVVGWRDGEGRLAGRPGALLLAVPDAGGLRYAGRVGSGLGGRELDHLAALLAPLARAAPPVAVPRDVARGAHWVEPRLVGEVAYGEWTREGRLRHPVWVRLRPDAEPGDVAGREEPA